MNYLLTVITPDGRTVSGVYPYLVALARRDYALQAGAMSVEIEIVGEDDETE